MSTQQGTTLLMCMVLAGIMYVRSVADNRTQFRLVFHNFSDAAHWKTFPLFFFLESPHIFWNDIEYGKVG
jgi:hypothetical protein